MLYESKETILHCEYRGEAVAPLLRSKQKYTYNTYKITHMQLYIGNIIAKKIVHITATYKISEH